jgi:hypothetical protein
MCFIPPQLCHSERRVFHRGGGISVFSASEHRPKPLERPPLCDGETITHDSLCSRHQRIEIQGIADLAAALLLGSAFASESNALTTKGRVPMCQRVLISQQPCPS